MNGHFCACLNLYTLNDLLTRKHRQRVSTLKKWLSLAVKTRRRFAAVLVCREDSRTLIFGRTQPPFRSREKYLQNSASPLPKRTPAAVVVAKGTSPFPFLPGKGVNGMDLQDFQRHKQHAFDAYCKKILKNAARDIYRRLARQAARELSLSDLPEDGAGIAAVMDEYFEEERQFEALGFSVTIKSELLAEALRLLPERQREIIMRYYFLGMTDGDISDTSNTAHKTVNYQRNAALKKLKQIMEGLQNEQ